MSMISQDLVIKICGLTKVEPLEAAITARAHMLGLVFFPKSPRHLALDKATTLAAHVKPAANAEMSGVKLVGLLVDPDDRSLDRILTKVPLDYIQLHGGENAARIRAIKTRTGLPIIKAIGVKSKAEVIAAHAYADTADMLLFDAKPPAGSQRPGGLGSVFDWQSLAAYEAGTPFLLSGGLTPDNVAQAITQMQDIPGFAGLDVSSGVETSPGKKDIALIERFIHNARDAISAMT